MDTGQRKSSLLFHLGQAHSKISSLEEYIQFRERQFRSVVGQFERTDSRSVGMGGTRLRRAGLSHNLLHLRSVFSEEEKDEHVEEAKLYSEPLDGFACLRINRVVPSSDNPDEIIPFCLRQLVTREYHVGKGGVVIGDGAKCDVRLPSEAGLEDEHTGIEWKSDVVIEESEASATPTSWPSAGFSLQCGHFVIRDLTEGKGIFSVSPWVNLQHSNVTAKDHLTPHTEMEAGRCSVEINTPKSASLPVITGDIKTASSSDKFVTLANTGMQFIAGRLEFSLRALPAEVLLTLKMFDAAKRGNLKELVSILESSKNAGAADPGHYAPLQDFNRLSSTSELTNHGVDINVEYQAPSYSDEQFFSTGFNRRRSSLVRGVGFSSPFFPGGGPGCDQGSRGHSLLLHIAIEQNNLKMASFLVSEKADVNRCSGELKQTALHLAAKLNLRHMVAKLLSYGGDVEVLDTLHRQPLALTSDYQVRKLLVSTVLLCSAAEAGDYGEVVRLMSSTDISPNACGLQHKNSLHLAAAEGHTQIVQCLLINGADVNAKGGTRQRTPLHYASLNDHVEVSILLLEAGGNEFCRDKGGYTPLNLSKGGKMCTLLHKKPLSLCLAVQSGDVEMVKKVLCEAEEEREAGCGDGVRMVDQRNEQSHAPLHLACTSGNLEVVQLLVAHGASIGLRGGSDSWTPLLYAAMAGCSHVVEFLLSVGADSQDEDEQGNNVTKRLELALDETKDLIYQLEGRSRTHTIVENALHTLEPASMIRRESGSCFSLEMERLWLSARAEKLKETLRVLTSGPDQLLMAIQTKNHSEFTKLLESGVVNANTMVDNYSPCSVLVRVCENGLTAFAQTLIGHGAQINQVGTSDQIPLLVAASNGNVDLVKLLCKSGADINIQSEDTMNTALHEAASSNSLGCTMQLLSAGAKLHTTNAAGETPFDCSLLHDIKRLLAVGANKLLLAAMVGDHHEIQRLVEEECMNPGHTYHLGVTALHEASEAGHLEACKILIQLGADVNKQIYASLVTPLHLASQNNHVEVARLLTSAGTMLDLKDGDGKVPFEVAHSNQMRKVLVEARPVQAQPVPARKESTERNCMICMDQLINTIILPCGHQAFCTACVSKISHCALDRQAIREVITVFK